jgi:hypothetical protein
MSEEMIHLMISPAAPEFVRAILEWLWTWPLARFALVMTFLAFGIRLPIFRGSNPRISPNEKSSARNSLLRARDQRVDSSAY